VALPRTGASFEDSVVAKDLAVALKSALELNADCDARVEELKLVPSRSRMESGRFVVQDSDSFDLEALRSSHEVVSASFVIEVADSYIASFENSNDVTLEILARTIEATLRRTETRTQFETVARVNVLSSGPVDISGINKSETAVNTTKADAAADIYPNGSFVYFANPSYDPDRSIYEDGAAKTAHNVPFLVGRVVSSRVGVYRLRIFDYVDTKKGTFAPRECSPTHASALEMSMKPIVGMIADLEGNWHCSADMSPLAVALNAPSIRPDARMLRIAPQPGVGIGSAVIPLANPN